MCGIAGYVGINQGAGEAVLDRMARQMVHRGPDGQGIAIHGNLGLVHRRLAVVDLDGGSQPMVSADGRWAMVYDGEVYNHRELRDELTRRGHTFDTGGDAEVVLAAWQHWQTAALERFTGMFALAVADLGTGDLVLARDQFGVKPLYLAADGSGRVAFASEIRPVLAAAVVPRRADDVSVYRYLCHGAHDDTERTFFARVSRLLPGQLARVGADGSVRRETYARLRRELDWLAAAPRPYGERDRDRIYAAVVAAVRRRLVGDVPIGTAHSGDLAGSTVVATVDHLLTERDPQAEPVAAVQRCFSATLDGDDHDEEPGVDAVAVTRAHRLAVQRVRPDVEKLLEDLTDFVRTQEEPVGSLAAYAQYCLMREASRHVTVILDGVGADLMFGGHQPHRRVHLRELIRRRRYVKAGVEVVRGAPAGWPQVRSRLGDRLRRRSRIAAEQVLDTGFVATHAGERAEVVAADLKGRLADDIFHDSLPAQLRYRDRNTMRFSVEGRSPFLDPPLLRLLWGLETSALICGGWDRRALREATAGLLPRRVRWSRNRNRPQALPATWLARLKNFVYEVLCSDSFGARPYFDQACATAAFRAFVSGQRSADATLFWRLINMELWLREFIDSDPTVPLAAAAVRSGSHRRHGARARRRLVPHAHPRSPSESDWAPNHDRQVRTRDGRWARYPLRVDLVQRGDDVAALAGARAAWFFTNLEDAPPPVMSSQQGNRWYLFCSEKVVALCQGWSPHTRQVGPSRWSRWQRGSPAEPTTPPAAQPLPSAAAAASSDPETVARHVSATVRAVVPLEARQRFAGTVVIDVTDLGPTVLGHDTDQPTERLAEAFADDPLRQDSEQTPFAVVVALP